MSEPKTWKQRIAAARKRGAKFSTSDQFAAGHFNTCAVGEALGRRRLDRLINRFGTPQASATDDKLWDFGVAFQRAVKAQDRAAVGRIFTRIQKLAQAEKSGRAR